MLPDRVTYICRYFFQATKFCYIVLSSIEDSLGLALRYEYISMLFVLFKKKTQFCYKTFAFISMKFFRNNSSSKVIPFKMST